MKNNHSYGSVLIGDNISMFGNKQTFVLQNEGDVNNIYKFFFALPVQL